MLLVHGTDLSYFLKKTARSTVAVVNEIIRSLYLRSTLQLQCLFPLQHMGSAKGGLLRYFHVIEVLFLQFCLRKG